MVGKKIRAYREFRGYSQIQLAELYLTVPSEFPVCPDFFTYHNAASLIIFVILF